MPIASALSPTSDMKTEDDVSLIVMDWKRMVCTFNMLLQCMFFFCGIDGVDGCRL